MSVAAGCLAIVLAAGLLRWPIGPDWLAIRIAALSALVGVQAVVAPTRLGDWLTQAVQWFGDLVGQLVGQFDPSVGVGVATVFLPALVLITAIIWIGSMLTSRTARYTGGVSNEEFSQGRVWAGAVILGVFAAALPGALGNLLGGLLDIATNVGEAGVQWAVA